MDKTSRVQTQQEDTDLKDPGLYINRELSLLEFNRRVLAQAKDPETPLLERLRFLTICSTNLDEFFEIRVAGLKQQVEYGIHEAGMDGLNADQTLQHICRIAHQLVEEQYHVMNETLLPELQEEGIRVLNRHRWSKKQQKWAREFFRNEVVPVLTPMGLDLAHPFPQIVNKSLNFIVSLRGKDAFGRKDGIAVVQVPRSLPRLIAMPERVAEAPHEFVMLSSVIHANIDEIFPGLEVTGCYQFRVTRNSDLWVDEEEVDDLLHALKGELHSRNFGDAVRIEIADNCSPEMARFLLDNFNLEEADLYRVRGPVNLHRLQAIYNKVERPDLKFQPFRPVAPFRFSPDRNVFDVIKKGNILLHHPYQSFAPVVDLVRQAASDPDVLAIKLTLYRTGTSSPLVDLLVDAAQAGTEVTAVVELRARFDEAANISLATRLQEAGAKVVYGIVGYKTHAKMLLVVRREGDRLRRYVHLGTGNYHLTTTRAYSDFGLLSCEDSLGQDVHQLFMQLTGMSQILPLKKILQSPFRLQKTLLELIDQEIANVEAGKEARIMARMNSLSEPKLIRALYRASQAGVKIDLIVRGICCLRPGLPDISENIRVRSIVGRFLEHSRLFYFWADGKELTYGSSADWMPRNLYQRVETCFPIEEPALRARAVEEGLHFNLLDNCQAWDLAPDGTYALDTPGKAEEAFAAQRALLERHTM